MIVFKNYAEAIAEKSSENDLRTYVEDLQEFLKVFENSEVQSLLKSPILSSEKKVTALASPLAGLNPKVVKLISALIKRGHSLRLQLAINEVLKYLEQKSGYETAVVRTPVELDGAEIESLKSSLAKILNKKIKIEVILDKTLIAGFKVQVAGKYFDNSISNHLKKIRDRFKVSEGSYEN